MIRHEDDRLTLCPTYDHGSSLGRELSDQRRLEALTTRDRNRMLAHYCDRPQSRFFPAEGGGKCLHLLKVFEIAAGIHPDAAAFWLTRLGRIEAPQIDACLARVPDPPFSAAARQFARAMLLHQRDQLLPLSGRLTP